LEGATASHNKIWSQGAASQRQTGPRDVMQTQKPCAQGTLFWEQTASLVKYSWNSCPENPTLVSCRARLVSLATRTPSTTEEKKNICQSSKCFNYPTPTRGSFGNCPSALQSANQGPYVAKHLSTCTIPYARVVAWNNASSRDLLAFSLRTDTGANNPGMGSTHARCCMDTVAGVSVGTGDIRGHSPSLPSLWRRFTSHSCEV